jgi:hypothetical protein
MFHAYVERFDVMNGRGNILGLGGESEQGQRELLQYFPSRKLHTSQTNLYPFIDNFRN